MEREIQVAKIAYPRKSTKAGNGEDFAKAWTFVDQNSSKFVDELLHLVSQPSISSQNLGLKECAELIRSMMVGLGIKTQIIPMQDAPEVVYGELRSDEKDARTLVIYNHYDVQPAEPLDEWKTDPFKGQVIDGKIYGRGAGDDKGELAARLCAIRTLLDSGDSVSPNIKWIIEGEEEIGSRHLYEFVWKNRSLLKGDGCLWEGGDRSSKGTPEVHLGTKGLLYVEFKTKTADKDLHSTYSPIAPNPAWRLVNLLKTIRDENGHILIDGFYDDVKKPSALERKFLQNNEFDSKELKASLNLDHLNEGKDNLETLTNLLYNPTANIAGFTSGYGGEGAMAIVPSEASVKMDFRLVANMKAKDTLGKIKEHLKSKGFDDVSVTLHWMEDPAKTPVESDMAQTIIHCVRLVTGKQPNVWPTSLGTSILGLFTDKLKLEAAMGLGVAYPSSNFHGSNEHIRVEDYKEAIKELVCLFRLF